MGVSMFGKLTTSRLLGDSEKGRERHSLSLSRTDSGLHTTVVDDWVDSHGHVHKEVPGSPMVAHIVEDLVIMKGKIGAIEVKLHEVLTLLALLSDKK